VGGSGHFDPLVPVARAAEAAGHEVAVSGQPALIPTVQASGFRAFATGADSGDAPQRLPLLEPSTEREDRVLREGFAGSAARDRARDILVLCAEWRPDIVVCDEIDFGSMIAAECLGLPYASVLVIAAGSFVRNEVVAEPLNELRAEHGLPADPELTMLKRYLVLSPFPPGFRDPTFALPATAHTFFPRALNSTSHETVPPWVSDLGGERAVYFTLGTVFNLESGDLFNRVLTGLSDLPTEVVVTVGRHIDPAEFGPQPANVHIERYIPQSSLLPHCSAVVSHGGSGSVLGALAHGLPMVLLPMGADQPLNAARCDELGIARVLNAVTCTPEIVRDAVLSVLADSTFRTNAERIRHEISALPDQVHAVRLIERLAVEKRPLSTACGQSIPEAI
jgi:UDP:flavonoid glycosyltransferase YjiC (YdhE family)